MAPYNSIRQSSISLILSPRNPERQGGIMDSSPLKTTTISFCPDQPFPADEISSFLHQFLLRHPPSSLYPPPLTPPNQSVATLVKAGSSVLDPPHDGRLANNLIHFGGNEPPDGREAESEEAPMDDLLQPPPPSKPPRSASASKRTRAAEVHNLSEKRRRSRINEKMKALQNLIPNSNKTDKASMLDEAIEYLKQLVLQVQVLSMRSGVVGLNQMSHKNIAESFLQQQAHQSLPTSQFGRETSESGLMRAKAEAASAMNEQKSPAAAVCATGVVINLGRQSSASIVAKPETQPTIRSSYLSYSPWSSSRLGHYMC